MWRSATTGVCYSFFALFACVQQSSEGLAKVHGYHPSETPGRQSRFMIYEKNASSAAAAPTPAAEILIRRPKSASTQKLKLTPLVYLSK